MLAGFLGVVLIASFQSNFAFSNSLSQDALGVILTFVVAWNQAAINVVNRKLKEVHYAVPIFF